MDMAHSRGAPMRVQGCRGKHPENRGSHPENRGILSLPCLRACAKGRWHGPWAVTEGFLQCRSSRRPSPRHPKQGR